MKKLLFWFIAVFAFIGLAVTAHAEMIESANTSYFPVLPFEAASDATPQLVPIAGNFPLDSNHAGITSAVVVIHDFQRDAQNTLTMLSRIAGANNNTTIILAPQFLIDFDVARVAEHMPDHGKMFARWTLGGWDDGGDSLTQTPQKPVSSFTVVDMILLYLADKHSFPDMRQITIAGHGAGGDFVQRYAAVGRATDLLDKQNLPVRFLVANASSYLYFTDLRPRSTKPLGFVTADTKSCPNLGTYGFGLHDLNDYARRVGPNDMKLHFPSRSVTYLVGEKVASGDPIPDTSCAATMQGMDRASRAMFYSLYLTQLYGEMISAKQKFVAIPKVGYDAAALFSSPCGMSVLFGNGNCETETPGFKSSGTAR